MIRAGLLVLLLSGCSVIEHVRILPAVNPATYDMSCCVAYWELSRSTSGSIEIKKGPNTWSISATAHTQF